MPTLTGRSDLPQAGSQFEEAIRNELRNLSLSPSHDFSHLDLVLSYALQLQIIYGGDIDIVTAATLLHDLGRGNVNLHGVRSADESANMAYAVLDKVNFPSDKIAAVLKAIKEHDQPTVRPTSLEGRILKDADFLAGFGVLGIVRSAIWTGESGGNLVDFIERVGPKMLARMKSLEFDESRLQAQSDYLNVRLFLTVASKSGRLSTSPGAPYVVFEGISGAGKTTQAELLAQHYRQVGISPRVHREPTPLYHRLKSAVLDKKGSHKPSSAGNSIDRSGQMLLLLADRYLSVHNSGRSLLDWERASGHPVISDRSYLSTMVYQSDGFQLTPAHIAFMHFLMPQPTDIFLLDVEPTEARRRIDARYATKSLWEGTQGGEHESLDQLTQDRERFLALESFFPYMHIVSSQSEPERIHETIWRTLSSPNTGHE